MQAKEETGISFEGMAAEAVKDMILKYVTEINSLEGDRKEFNAGVRDTIKDLKRRIKTALEYLDR